MYRPIFHHLRTLVFYDVFWNIFLSWTFLPVSFVPHLRYQVWRKFGESYVLNIFGIKWPTSLYCYIFLILNTQLNSFVLWKNILFCEKFSLFCSDIYLIFHLKIFSVHCKLFDRTFTVSYCMYIYSKLLSTSYFHSKLLYHFYSKYLWNDSYILWPHRRYSILLWFSSMFL